MNRVWNQPINSARILENMLSLPKDIIGRRKTILLSVVTLAGSLAGIVLSPKLGSWKYLLLFCTTAGFSCGAQAKMTLPMEIFGTKERSSIGRVFNHFHFQMPSLPPNSR